jgi:hypothetical protein
MDCISTGILRHIAVSFKGPIKPFEKPSPTIVGIPKEEQMRSGEFHIEMQLLGWEEVLLPGHRREIIKRVCCWLREHQHRPSELLYRPVTLRTLNYELNLTYVETKKVIRVKVHELFTPASLAGIIATKEISTGYWKVHYGDKFCNIFDNEWTPAARLKFAQALHAFSRGVKGFRLRKLEGCHLWELRENVDFHIRAVIRKINQSTICVEEFEFEYQALGGSS